MSLKTPTDSWDESPAEAPKDPFREAALTYADCEKRIKYLREEQERAGDILRQHFPEDFGEHVKSSGNVTVKATINERWSWDSEALERAFVTHPMPEYVKRRLSISRSAYEALPPAEQAELSPALTRKPGKPKIEVIIS